MIDRWSKYGNLRRLRRRYLRRGTTIRNSWRSKTSKRSNPNRPLSFAARSATAKCSATWTSTFMMACRRRNRKWIDWCYRSYRRRRGNWIERRLILCVKRRTPSRWEVWQQLLVTLSLSGVWKDRRKRGARKWGRKSTTTNVKTSLPIGLSGWT